MNLLRLVRHLLGRKEDPTMDPNAAAEALSRSFLDRKLSRNERQALAASLAGLAPGTAADAARRHAFDLAREALRETTAASPVLDWLEEVVRVIPTSPAHAPSGRTPFSEAQFSPGDDCLSAIARRIRDARTSIDVCVFTVTDDRISSLILDAHHRRVAVRVLTDDDKAHDEGSDIGRFADAGIAVRVDRTPAHMHHKFAIFDGTILLTGSYNWTRGAARDNQENLIVTHDRGLVAAYAATFERLWEQLR